MKYEKSCGAVVYKVEYGTLYFLLEHMVQGHTSIPKGHVEGNETEAETALREIREETGLEVRLDTVFRHDVWYSPYEGIKKQVIFFAAELAGGEMKNQECEVSGLEWVPYDRAIEEVTFDTDKEVLTHAAVYLDIRNNLRLEDKNIVLRPYGTVWYREHAVDIHSHVLPCVDDGSEHIEESWRMLRLDWEEGIRVVFATPHYGIENGYAPDKNTVEKWFRELSLVQIKAEQKTSLKLGTEWYCSDHLLDRIRNKEAFPMGDSDWYMVEFQEWGDTTEPADVMLRRLKKLRDNGINTILAHPERYKALQQDYDVVKRIRDMDVLFQVNAYDLYLNPKDDTRNLAQWMAKEEMISFLGSDMHGTRPGKRTPKMKEGINWLYENVDYEYANDVVRANAERLLGVERLLG